MQLDSTFSVVAPIDQVWETLMDVERVAGCVPGAHVLNRLSEDTYQIGLKVKLGPVTMQYKGQLTLSTRDATAHLAVFDGRAQETRGQGTAQGTATLRLVESAGTTTGTVSADLALSGKVAAMGQSVIGSVTDQMMALFADNLQAMVESPAGAATAPPVTGAADPGAADPGDTNGTVHMSEPAEKAAAAAQPARPAAADPAPVTARPSVPPSYRSPARSASRPAADTSLNGLTLLKGLVMDQLHSPAKLVALLAAVAFVAFRLGRRGSGR